VSGGRASREKGNRTERAIVRLLQDRGFAAEKVPLSGAVGGRFGGDVSVPLLGIDRRAEVKCRSDGFRELYGWLEGHDFLIVKADRKPLLVVVPLSLAVEIVAMTERAKGTTQP
jgi:Holliday junction resolvase